jgi:hypothetical protein
MEYLDRIYIDRQRTAVFSEQLRSLKKISARKEVNLDVPGHGNIAIRPGAIVILEGGRTPRMFPDIDFTKSVFVQIDPSLAKARAVQRSTQRGYSVVGARIESLLSASSINHRWLGEGLNKYDYIIEVAADGTFNMLMQNPGNRTMEKMGGDQDRAMSSTGGIDLTSNKVLSVQNSGQGIQFYTDPAMLQRLQNAPGFVPVIINIQPMTDLRKFLEVVASQ